MSASENLVFRTELQEVPVIIQDESYVLVELDGKGRDQYLNNLGGRMRPGADGRPNGVKNFDGLQATLVSMCLRKVDGTERKAVTIETIQAWPSRVVAGLFDAARKLNSLGEEGEAAAKNE